MRSPNAVKYRTEPAPRQKRIGQAAAEGIDSIGPSTELRQVLFISYSFPPNVEMGANTCAQIARYLPMYGWRPIVLTVKEKYIEDRYLNRNGASAAVDSNAIIRTSLFPHPLDIYRQFKSNSLTGKLFHSEKEQARSSNSGAADHSVTHSDRAARNLLLSLLSLPDVYTGWVIPAALAGLRAIRQTGAQAIYSSAPYFTAHLAGYALSLLTGLPWVAHFRDPWVTGLLPEYCPNALFRKISGALERLTVTRARAVICVTEEHAELMRAAYDTLPASKFVVVMNGFDGLEWKETMDALGKRAQGAAGRRNKFRITYAGKLYMKRNPSPVFRALRTLIDAGEINRKDVRVELIGWCESSEGHSVADLISEAGLEDCVDMVGPLSHSETLGRLSRSNLLLLLAEGLVTQIPGKTFEYLKTRRPILALTSAGAVASLLQKTGGGWVVPPEDQAGVVEAVRECYQTWKQNLPGRVPDATVVENFDRRKTTGRIADLLNSLTIPRRDR
jgi:glycosyltransferase involved in cell wall biosynthesis